MPVLIDGYNLYHAAQVSPRGPWHLGRSQLARILGAWSERVAEKVTVVFDGAAPPADLAGQLADPRIGVVYSGPGMTADERITEYLQQDDAARSILVVSSDREVQRSAKRRLASVVGSEAFFERVLRELRRPATPPKWEDGREARGTEAEEVDAWLKTFGFDPSEPGGFEHP